MSGFFVSDIDKTNIVIGPYPLYQVDIDEIARTGAKAVINLQTPGEIAERQADTKLLDAAYRNRGINTFHHIPIDDSTEESFQQGVMETAQRLNHLINEKKMKVYLHCTSSVTRAPTAAIVYLCLYVRTYNYKKQWKDHHDVAGFVKKHHP